jgi:quercetin dioxygenase-like cupin family protein
MRPPVYDRVMTEDPTSFADLAAEVEIPTDGTISRVVFRNDRLRVVVFGFDAGQELTDHTAAVPAIIEVVSGRLEVTLGDDQLDATPGTWIHMPANLSHAVVALEPSVMLLSLLR